MKTESDSLTELMIDQLEHSDSPVATLEILKTKAQVKYMCNKFEGMRRGSALESLLYDHADDITYGWGSLAWLAPEMNQRPGGHVFSIRRHENPQPTPNLLICKAVVSTTPVPYTNADGIPYNPAYFGVIKQRLLKKVSIRPNSEETLKAFIRSISLTMNGALPVLINNHLKVISDKA